MGRVYSSREQEPMTTRFKDRHEVLSGLLWMVGHTSIDFFDRPALPRRKNNGRVRRDPGGTRLLRANMPSIDMVSTGFYHSLNARSLIAQ